ncbi:diversity-generating retroelement protein Avd [Thioalkalivibrio sp. ALMg9]|uniref:diversity-generating retroelement protein Avd n=1 Tax=Thioalkalivibrio sp. ALMg9 TaxID=1266912 RepID=UPI00037EEE1E|nr:diversity-generating retroelement protein Avd [Thioalkalivibrio sp. ALMg9]
MASLPEEAPRQRGLAVVNKAERLIVDLGPALDRVPRTQRYRYATRVEDALWELVQRLIEAAMSGQKSKIYRADEQVRFIHALLRVGAERKWLSPKRVGDAAGMLGEIGSMIGAWRQRIGAA